MIPRPIRPGARRQSSFTPPASARQRQVIVAATIVIASAVAALLPIVATAPVVPPLGFLMLLAWRLPRPDRFALWMTLPLGLIDDLLSGAPLGTAACLWTLTFLALEAIDRRYLWRGFREDWAVAALLIAAERIASLALANVTGGATPAWLIGPPIVAGWLLYPLFARIAAGADRWRLL